MPSSTLHGNRRQSTAIDGNPMGTNDLNGDDHDATNRLPINRHFRWLLGLQPEPKGTSLILRQITHAEQSLSPKTTQHPPEKVQ